MDFINNATANSMQWRLLHSYIVDAILSQPGEEERLGLAAVFGGLSCRRIFESLNSQVRTRVRSMLDDDGVLIYRVEVLDDFGSWQGLTRPPASALGFDPDEALTAEQWLWRLNAQRDGLPVDPDDEVG